MYRRREPTNPKVAAHFTQMVFDHSQQLFEIPDSRRNHVVNASRLAHDLRTTNSGGRSAQTLNAMLGGAPDYKGPIHAPGGINTTPAPNGGRQGGGDTPYGTVPKRRMGK
jgi:hypothetical protein